MDPRYLDVENLDYGIDKYEEFNLFEDEENLTPLVTLNPSLLLIPIMLENNVRIVNTLF